jgi:adenylate cyclase
MRARSSPDRDNWRREAATVRFVAFEIERKFLVRAVDAAALAAAAADELEIEQTYLRGSSEQSLRVRRSTRPDGSEERTETRKRRISARTREEIERDLDPAEYRQLVEQRDPSRQTIRKRRFKVPIDNGLTCEIDVFSGDLTGLVLAEVELPDEQAAFRLPEWLTIEREVTDDPAYTNSALARLDTAR